jgi:DNA-binding transcriptional LysR family regulator
MVPDSRQLRYFVAVAEELQFSRAARRLGMSQSALSESIRRLESQVGVELLRRSTRAMTLTEPGERLLASARIALDAVAQTRVALEDPHAAAILRLGFSPELRPALFDALVGDFALACPDAVVSLREQASQELLGELGLRRLDACVTCCAGALGGQRSERFAETPAIVAVGSDDRRAGAAGLELADLADLPLVLSAGSASAGPGAVALAACRSAGFEPRVAWVPYAAVAAVFTRAGGFTLVPSVVALRTLPRVAFASLATPVTMPFDLVWRDEAPSAPVRAFLERARSVAQAAPWTAALEDVGDRGR